MSATITEYNVFIASPGDVPEERTATREICESLNNDSFVKDKKIRLNPVGWEDVIPEAGRPQAIINQLQQECDIFICMLYRRYGTPTGGYDSGTEEEFLNAYEKWKNLSHPKIMFYFKEVLISSARDFEDPQLKKVFELKEKIQANEMLLYGTFKDTSDFKKIITEDLKKQIIQISKGDTKHNLSGKKSYVKAIIPDQYRRWVMDITKYMDIDLLRGDKKVDMSLPGLYQPLYTDDPDRKRDAKDLHMKDNLIDIETLAMKGESLVIQGRAGSGKTTLMRHLLRSIINNKNEFCKVNTLPVILFMKDFKQYPYTDANLSTNGVKALDWYFKNIVDNGLNTKIIEKFCEEQRAVFLIDGLDELEKNIRDLVVKALADFRLKYENIKIVFAGRPHGLKGVVENRFGKQVVNIHDFDNKQVETFIYEWFIGVYGKDSFTGIDIAKKMTGEIRTNEDIDDLKQNPLMLTAMCILYYDEKILPDQRSELYDRFINRLFSKFETEKKKVRSFMMELAWHMFEDKSRKIDQLGAVKILKNHFNDTDESYKDKFEKIESKSGLMHIDGGQYQFSHRTFQEFLSASYLCDNIEESPYEKIAGYMDDEWYREVVELFIGFLSDQNSGGANGIVRKVLDEKPDDHYYRWRVVSKALLDIHKDKRNQKVCDLAMDRMLTVIRAGESPGILNEVGENLGRLGYDKGYTDFIKIGKGDYDLENIGVKTIPAFEISQYPVTNLWFKQFIDDSGYENRQLWSKEGRKFLDDTKVTEPGFWHERKFNCPNSPVVGVSWYEADAFCKWLTHIDKGNYKYRLLSEFEWQAAAAGFEQRKYPWGHADIEPTRCNYDESKIGRISPVGIFQKGQTKQHVHDLAGNVWEWTRTDHKKQENFDDFIFNEKAATLLREEKFQEYVEKVNNGEFSAVVLRGGSFGGGSDGCRCAYRFSYFPFDRDRGVGFRCSRIKL